MREGGDDAGPAARQDVVDETMRQGEAPRSRAASISLSLIARIEATIGSTEKGNRKWVSVSTTAAGL